MGRGEAETYYCVQEINIQVIRMIIDRNSKEDAQNVIENFLPDKKTRDSVIKFLLAAIAYADKLNNNNWNLNLDKNGTFIWFNIGCQYCITIKKQETLILCDRLKLQQLIETQKIAAVYRGYRMNRNRKLDKVESTELEQVPDTLVSTPNSIGCVFKNTDVANYLEYVQSSNIAFIKAAMNTTIRSRMRNAHSKGVLAYFSEYLNQSIPNPLYATTLLEDIEQFKNAAQGLSATEREAVIQSRIGQGQFRDSLIKYWRGCSVTGCKQFELLKASHIKPWRNSTPAERLDPFNGLLLIPNLDTCFDSGWISFDDEGKIILSSRLNQNTLLQLGINSDLKLSRVEPKHQDFLRYHRENLFI